jgi:hypothetical protein
MTRFMEWGFIVPSESSLGAQKVSLRSSSPAFSFSQEPRLAHNTTRVPRGLMGYDHRPITEYKYDIPGSMSKQLESTRPTSPTFTFSSCVHCCGARAVFSSWSMHVDGTGWIA